MKAQIILQMVLDLLTNGILQAKFFSKKYGICTRTVYRYLQEIELIIPLTVTGGVKGGFRILPEYKKEIKKLIKE